MSKRIVVGVTGASGAALALETLRQLRERGAETHLVVSRGARLTIQYELGGGGFDRLCEVASHVHGASELDAPIASGSFQRTEWQWLLVRCGRWPPWRMDWATIL